MLCSHWYSFERFDLETKMEVLHAGASETALTEISHVGPILVSLTASPPLGLSDTNLSVQQVTKCSIDLECDEMMMKV